MPAMQRAVAVKVFSSPFGATPEARADFAREWERLKQIQHPAIVRCYGGGFEETDAYLAHELIEGETLASQLERRTRLSWEVVLELVGNVVQAEDEMQIQLWIHRKHGRVVRRIGGDAEVERSARVRVEVHA